MKGAWISIAAACVVCAVLRLPSFRYDVISNDRGFGINIWPEGLGKASFDKLGSVLGQ